MFESVRRCRIALLTAAVPLLSLSPTLAQGLPSSEGPEASRLGTQYLWSPDGVECIAGCKGIPEPIELGGGTNWDVDVTNFAFTPEILDILPGDSVTWTNVSGVHNVRADDDSFRCANGCDGQGGNGDPAGNAWVVTLTFPDAATIPYYCELHGGDSGAGMSGVIHVFDPFIFEDGFESGDTGEWSTTVEQP